MTEDLHAAVQSEHTRARVVLALLAIAMLVDGIAVFSGFAQYSLLASARDGVEISAEAADANDSRQQLIGILQILIFVGTAVSWLVWQYRAYANLKLVGSRDTEVTEGWSVGYWFIPLVNLVRVYQITNELWRRSELKNIRDPIGGLSGTPLIVAWWLVYLVTGFLGRTSLSMSRHANTIPQLLDFTNISILSDVAGIVSAILAFIVVRGIDLYQREFTAAPITA